MSPTPQQDISTLIKMRKAIRARRPPKGMDGRHQPTTPKNRSAVRAAASVRWEQIYGLIGEMQKTYNAAQDQLGVTVKLRKSFPDAWQPAYVVSFLRFGEEACIDIRLTMSEENVVSFVIWRRHSAKSDPEIIREGATLADLAALRLLFREMVRCFFLQD